MPATSLASADEAVAVEERHAPTRARPRQKALSALWPEAIRAELRRGWRCFLVRLRQSWLYRRTLGGPVPDRIVFHPDDPRARKLDEADAYFHARFRFAGSALDVKEGSVFDQPIPSPQFALALHGFDGLRHLEAAGSDISRKFALALMSQWLARNARYQLPAWEPEIIAERFINLFSHGRFFLTNTDLLWRSKLFVSLRNQARMLARTINEAPEGLPRLKCAAALALSGLCLWDSRNAHLGLARLGAEIERQILPDGGHISRSPEALIEALLVLSMVQQALENANRETHASLRSALDRMAPMLRFFMHGDGGLAVFNGGSEGDGREIAQLLARDHTRERPFGHAPHSAYQRLTAGRTLVLLDAGKAPQSALSRDAHAGCLAFEMSAGAQRIVVNCGAARGQGQHWETALKATAAHSTLTLNDTSSTVILDQGWLARALGQRLVNGPALVESRRTENAQGLTVDANHDGYLAQFGIVHKRRMTLSPKGLTLTGQDQLVPGDSKLWSRARKGAGSGISFAVRFHIHPDIRLSLSQGGGSVILKLPNGEGWRFRCGGGVLSIEESIYFGAGHPRRAEQLVIAGQIKDQPVECAWLFEHVGHA